MKVSFRRWLPAITRQASSRWLPAITRETSRRAVIAMTTAQRATARYANARTVAENARTVGQNARTVGQVVAKTDLRKGALVLAGLALVGGIAAGPGGATQPAPAGQPAAATASAAPDAPTPAPATNPAGASADQGAPSLDQLIPHGTQGEQSTTPLSSDQINNAKTIVDTAKKMGLPDRAAVIGVATSLQESKLNNFGHLGDSNDHDSLGLFQQRPSSGWGTPDQVTDPEYAATAFFDGLERVNGWQDMPLTDAAQTVQVSAYPSAYAQWEQQAADIVQSVDHGR